MRFRRDFVPKTINDMTVTVFVIVIIPVIYWYELFLVMPTFHQQWSVWYNVHFVLGTFILFNIATNFMGTLLCDTSIRGLMLPATMQQHWRLCSICECVAPPRSWHCSVCRTCILKRDHHCVFTGCCIGHCNLRYFLMFVMHIFIATSYASYFNFFYVSRSIQVSASFASLLKLIFPLAMLFVEYTWTQLYLFLALIVAVACVFTGVLCYFHVNLICRGMVTHDQRVKQRLYDRGTFENIRVALGRRWYIVWLSPFIESTLTHDGINWMVQDTSKTK